jgi:hypothetical protein
MERTWVLVIVGTAACALHADPVTEDASCEDVVCSTNATCGGGECFCDQGYEGDPYALEGCQPIRPPPIGDCEGGCGENAYCADGNCYCEEGTVAVCGTPDCIPRANLCDGTADCPNAADEDPAVCYPAVVQEWLLTDTCADGLDVEWRLWAWDRDWVWPGPHEIFVSGGLYIDSYEAIECAEGELICFGGQAGDRVWGVGTDGAYDCDDCCSTCAADLVDVGYLACE